MLLISLIFFDFGMSWILHCIIFYMFLLVDQYVSGPPLFYFNFSISIAMNYQFKNNKSF